MLKKLFIKSPFSRIKFRSQLLVSFLILAFVVTILITISINIVMKATILGQNERSLRYNVRQISSNIDAKMWHYERVSKQLTDLRFLDKLKAKVYEDKTGTYMKIKEYTSNMLSSERSSLKNIVIYEEGDTLIKDNDITLKMDNKIKKEVLIPLRVNADNILWNNTYEDKRGEKCFSLFSRNPNNVLNSESVWELRVYETELFSLIHEESQAYDIYVVSEEGVIMSATDRDIVGKEINELDQFHKSIITSASQGTNLKIDGREYIVASCISQRGLTVISASELTSMLTEFRNASGKLLMAFLGIILLAILLTILLSNRLNKRMTLLNRKIQLLRIGEFDQEVVIEGADEFSNLGLAIDDTRSDLKKFIQEIKETGEQKRRAEMIALRSQINTHFLFNALSSIKWLAVSYDADDIKEAIEGLSMFLKISLSRDGDLLPVELEIEHLRAYVYLQKMRYNNELEIEIDAPDEVMNYKTVRLVLQPMLENAIYHGRRGDGSILHISISAYIADEELVFEIVDDGLGMSEAKLEKVILGEAKTNYSGYGVANVDQRLRMCCGENYGLKIESKEKKGTKIIIKQPLFSVDT